MDVNGVLDVLFKLIGALGGGALIVIGAGSWLGKIWAARILEKDRKRYNAELEGVKSQLDTIKQKDLSHHFDKIAIYKDIIHIICEILEALDAYTSGREKVVSPQTIKNFSINRSKAYGYIALISTQEVMDEYNRLIDYLIPIIYEGEKGNWFEMRAIVTKLLNAMRKDVGVLEGEIFYRGKR